MPAPLREQVEALTAGFPGPAGIAAQHLATGEVVALNEAATFPTASMIKIMILFELVRQCARGRAHWGERIPLRAADRTLGSGLLLDLDEGLRPTLRDLAVLMMAISDNTATNMLLDRLGTAAINQACREAGMTATELRGSIDFDRIARSPDNLAVSTPRDFRLFLAALRRGELLPGPQVEQMLGIMRIQKYMPFTLRRLLPFDPYAAEFGEGPDFWIASKTGGLSGVRCEAGLIHTPRAEWAICVCTRGFAKTEAGSDDPGSRFIAQVSKILFDAWGGAA